METDPLPLLDSKHVLLAQRFATKQEVVKAIGEVFIRCGDTTPRYTEAMQRKEEEFNTCIAEGIALPHGTSEVRDQVLRSAVVVVQLPKGVDWGEGRIVYLAFGLAGRGDKQHLGLMAALARVLQDPANVTRLRATRDVNEVLSILDQQEEQTPA